MFQKLNSAKMLTQCPGTKLSLTASVMEVPTYIHINTSDRAMKQNCLGRSKLDFI